MDDVVARALLPEAIPALILRLLRRQEANAAARNDEYTVEKK
jgi:hypothetical protein